MKSLACFAGCVRGRACVPEGRSGRPNVLWCRGVRFHISKVTKYCRHRIHVLIKKKL
jgi:hypothetical protein